MKVINQKLFDEVCKDKQFLEYVVSLETDEQVKKAFFEKGIEMSEDEIKEFKKSVINTIESGKLCDFELEQVSGGSAKTWFRNNWNKLIYATCAVTATGAAVYMAKNFKRASQVVEEVGADISESCNSVNSAASSVNSAASSVNSAANNASELATNANEKVKKLGNGWVGRAFFGSQR